MEVQAPELLEGSMCSTQMLKCAAGITVTKKPYTIFFIFPEIFSTTNSYLLNIICYRQHDPAP